MKTIKISQFKTHISEELKRVRRGERIIITDRDTPIAEVIPYEKKPELIIRPPRGKLTLVRPSFKVAVDPMVFLMEDRQKR